MQEWKEVTLIGLGSQGKAWAQNLIDSGLRVHCYLRPNSPSRESAENLGLSLVNDLKSLGPYLLLIPDNQIPPFLQKCPLPEGACVIYAHGASMVEHRLQERYPQYRHLLLAPKAIASELRANYQNGGKTGAVYSVEFVSKQENEKEDLRSRLLSLSQSLGITAGPYEVTFEQETTADLLSEQSLLCGLIPYAAKYCFDSLIKQGIPKELAYLEAWHEVKLIGNAMSQHGPAGLFSLISPHALVGAHLASQELFDKGYQETIEKLLNDIQSGEFFKKAHEFFEKETTKEVQDFWASSQINHAYEELRENLAD